ncbi:MAG: helix-turn-helix domain-containing protein [Candidatus Paceibacterota bacterium]|jgi:hypothetical protein
MQNLKKVIPLSEASKIYGYHSDYLSSLIRKGEIKGKKVGGSWFTTEEAIKEYLFKQKVRHKKFALVDFFSPTRMKKILFSAGLFFVVVVLVSSYIISRNTKVILEEGKKAPTSDLEGIKEFKQ